MMKKSQGFSLVELVVIICVIAIMSVSVMLTNQTPGVSVVAQANQLVDDIRYTQSLAMTKGVRYGLVITTATSSYQIVNASGAALMLARGSTTMTLGQGISFGAITNLAGNIISFDGLGNPYNTSVAAGTALASTATIVLSAGTLTSTVSITPNTGMVIAS
jgi:type II secretory pathway pseudopilin PulG